MQQQENQQQNIIDVSRWFDKGFAEGVTGPQIPPGYCYCKNMMLEPDGKWCSRYTYKKNHSVKLSAGAYIKNVYCTNADDLLCINNLGAPFYKDASFSTWTACTWQGGGSAPALTGTIESWCDCTVSSSAYVIFSDGNTVVEFYGTNFANFRYLGNSSPGFGGFLAEHEGRVWILRKTGSTLQYTKTTHLDGTTLDSFVNVGAPGDLSVGLHVVNGNLLVVRQKSLWWKRSRFSKPTSTAFIPTPQNGLFSGHTCDITNGCAMATAKGIMIVTDGNIRNISATFERPWITGDQEPKISWWKAKDWLIVSTGSTYSSLYVYDMAKQRWYFWNGLPICSVAQNPSGPGFYIALYQTTGDVYLMQLHDLLRIGDAGAEESAGDFEQFIQTPWYNFAGFTGNAAFKEKYLRAMWQYQANLEKIEVFRKNAPSFSDGVALETFDNIGNFVGIEEDDAIDFLEMSIKYTAESGAGKAGGTMILQDMALEVDFGEEDRAS